MGAGLCRCAWLTARPDRGTAQGKVAKSKTDPAGCHRGREGGPVKRIICSVMLIVLWCGSPAFGLTSEPAADLVKKAMHDELARSISKLRLAELDKPYFISYRIDDTSGTKISAVLGQLTDE